MTRDFTRRGALGLGLGATALAAGARPAWAASKTLSVLAHRVHQTSLTTGPAGDLTKPWREGDDADVAWTTFDTNPLQDRLLREASLDRTDFGVGFLVNSRATRDAAKLLQPLDDFQAKAPIEDFRRHRARAGRGDALRRQARRRAVPPRHAGPVLQRGAARGARHQGAARQPRGAGRPGEAG